MKASASHNESLSNIDDHLPDNQAMRQEEDFDANLAGEDSLADENKPSWFKRIKKGILTSTKEKKDAPEGLWTK